MLNKISLLLLFIVLFVSCKQDIEDYYYKDTEEAVNTDVMTLLKQNAEYSEFVSLLEKYKVDSLLTNGKTYTLFVPNNAAFESYEPGFLSEKDLIEYLVTDTYVNLSHITKLTKIQTLGGKFAEVEKLSNVDFSFDRVEVIKGSPLTNNGRFYEISKIVLPKPNLRQYIAATNGFYLDYLNSRDSIYLDRLLSTPIGYTDAGLTIYDSVMTKVNLFEERYFPVSREFRDNKATMLLFTQEQFDQALNIISSDLNITIAQIPQFWQRDILMPYLIEQSVFRNSLPYVSFLRGKARNIRGDSVVVEPQNINPDYFECSNGRVYKLKDFKVPERLYKMNDSVPMSQLVFDKGSGLWAWNLDVVTTGQTFNPVRSPNASAIFKNTLLLDMGRSFTGSFSLAYTHKNIFPATYKMTVRANISKTGVYKIFVNGKQYRVDIKDGKGPQLEFDFFDLRNGVISSVTNKFYPFQNNFCSFDIKVDNITEFGNVEVKFVYVKPSPRNANNSGLNIDFVSLDFLKQ